MRGEDELSHVQAVRTANCKIRAANRLWVHALKLNPCISGALLSPGVRSVLD